MSDPIRETSGADQVTNHRGNPSQLQKAKKMHQCSQCSYAAGDSSNLNKHVRAVHDKDRKFACLECNHRCAVRSDLAKHVAFVHRKERPYKCPHCDYTAPLNSSIKIHIRGRHDKDKVKNVVQCEHCEYTCSTSLILKTHIKSVHLGTFDFHCDVVGCGFKNNNRMHMRDHVKSVHLKIRDYHCDKCDFKAGGRNHVTRHTKSVHDKVKDHKCEHCDFATSERKTLVKHVQVIHLNVRNYFCDRCDYKSFTRAYFNLHVKKHEEEDNLKEEDLECHFCKRKDFQTRMKLIKHVAAHRAQMTMEKNKFEKKPVEKGDLICRLCCIGGFSKGRLKYHMRRHRDQMKREGEKEGQVGDLVCGRCGKGGLTKLRLEWHMDSHDDGEGDYTCSMCDRSDFKTGLSLRRHVISHKGAMTVKKRREENAQLEKRLQVDSRRSLARVTEFEKKGKEKRRMLVEEAEEVEYTDKGDYWEVDRAVKMEEEEDGTLESSDKDHCERRGDSDYKETQVGEKPEDVECTDKGDYWEVDRAIKTEEEEDGTLESGDENHWEETNDSDQEDLQVGEKREDEERQGGEDKAPEVKEEQEDDVGIDEDDFDGDDSLSVSEGDFFG